jgi:hypothetical protein
MAHGGGQKSMKRPLPSSQWEEVGGKGTGSGAATRCGVSVHSTCRSDPCQHRTHPFRLWQRELLAGQARRLRQQRATLDSSNLDICDVKSRWLCDKGHVSACSRRSPTSKQHRNDQRPAWHNPPTPAVSLVASRCWRSDPTNSRCRRIPETAAVPRTAGTRWRPDPTSLCRIARSSRRALPESRPPSTLTARRRPPIDE